MSGNKLDELYWRLKSATIDINRYFGSVPRLPLQLTLLEQQYCRSTKLAQEVSVVQPQSIAEI